MTGLITAAGVGLPPDMTLARQTDWERTPPPRKPQQAGQPLDPTQTAVHIVEARAFSAARKYAKNH